MMRIDPAISWIVGDSRHAEAPEDRSGAWIAYVLLAVIQGVIVGIIGGAL